MSIPISVFIVTLNEETNIKRLLPSLSSFDEVVVVDSGSTDKTCEIAREFGATVSFNEWPGYAKQKQYALGLCKNEWVLNLDADEYIPEGLFNEIKTSIEDSTIDSVKIARCDYFLNKPMPKYCKLFSNVRLYRKSKAHFDETFLVHESATVNGKRKFIKTPFLHYGYNDIKVLASKLNDYSTLKAQEKHDKGKKANTLKLALSFPVELIRKLLLQRFILFGFRGFILSVMYAHYSLLKEAKLYELQEKSRNKL